MNLSQAVRVPMVQYVEQEKEVTRRHEETLEALEDIETGEIMDGVLTPSIKVGILPKTPVIQSRTFL